MSEESKMVPPGDLANADAATPKSAAITPDHAFNWKVASAHVSALEDPKYGYRIGHIITRHGIVGLYDQPDPSHTRLDFTVGGRNYAATWVRTFSDRYLGTLATRFAASILDGAASASTTGADRAPGMNPDQLATHP